MEEIRLAIEEHRYSSFKKEMLAKMNAGEEKTRSDKTESDFS
jgi:queuine/archaeosine tRNA-ribosyltransferase